MALAAPAANAALVNMGGILIDPDFSQLLPPLADFTGQHKFLQFYVDDSSASGGIERTDVNPNATPLLTDAKAPVLVEVGDVLTGVGYIDIINGEETPNFCANSNCRLEFVFGGFKITDFYSPGDPVVIPLFEGGWINVYIDNSPPFLGSTYSAARIAEIDDNPLWLSLEARELTFDPAGPLGPFTTTLNFSSGSFLNGSVEAVLDVVGGLAKDNFDTNTINVPALGVLGGDLTYSGNARFTGENSLFSEEGNGQFRGDSIIDVPEPASLALLGIGLLGVGGMQMRRKNAKA
jgi:hypothetical protein